MNTFQINIVYNSNEDETLVILLYPEDQINWTTGDRDGGANGVGGNPAEVGLDSPQESLRIEPSGSNEIVNIETLSNIEIPGVFIFKVDTVFLERELLIHTYTKRFSITLYYSTRTAFLLYSILYTKKQTFILQLLPPSPHIHIQQTQVLVYLESLLDLEVPVLCQNYYSV